MKRKEFINKCGTCSAMSLIGLMNLDRSKDQAISAGNYSEVIPVNANQIRQLLKFIDSTFNEPDKEIIFDKLGYECLYSRNLDKWIVGFEDNQEEFFNRVKRGESTYWEKLEYDKGKSVITLIGRQIRSCSCEFGQGDQPPESLCNYCCKRFQEEMFSLLLDKKVTVRIDESVKNYSPPLDNLHSKIRLIFFPGQLAGKEKLYSLGIYLFRFVIPQRLMWSTGIVKFHIPLDFPV